MRRSLSLAAIVASACTAVPVSDDSQPLDVAYEDGLSVTGDAWWADFRATSFGRAGAMESLATPGPLGLGDKTVFERGAVDEWFRDAPRGIQQGFTVYERPAGDGWLTVDVAIDTHLVPRQISSEWIALEDASGSSQLAYAGLVAWDANGVELDARMTLTDGGFITLSVDDEGAAYPVTIDPFINQDQILVDATPVASAQYGWAVAVSGNTFMVSSPSEGAGKVTEIERTATTWTVGQTITASNGAAFERFGETVKMYGGDRLVVGTPFHDTYGAVYVYHREGGVWAEKLIGKPDLGGGTNSGSYRAGDGVAIYGNDVLLGAPNYDDGLSDTGKVFHWQWNGTAYVAQPPILNTTVAGAFFGDEIAMDSLTALIAAPEEVAGKVYVFNRASDSSPWTAGQTLTVSGSGHKFGSAIDIHGDRIAVTSPGENKVYTYTRSGVTWTLEDSFTVPTQLNSLDDIELEAGLLLVGLGGEDSDATGSGATVANSGAGILYSESGGAWTEVDRFKATDPATNDNMGYGVALHPNQVVMGSPNRDTAALANSGAVYAFNIGPYDPTGGLGDQCPTNPAKEQPGTCGCAFADVAVTGGTACVHTTATADGTLENGVYVYANAFVNATATVRAGAQIGVKATVGAGSDIGANTVLGRRSTVGDNCTLGTPTGVGVTVSRAVSIGAVAGTGCGIGDGSTLGYGVTVHDGAVLGQNVHVANLAVIQSTADIGQDGNSGVTIGRGANVAGIVKAGASIGPNGIIENGGRLGTDSKLRRGARINATGCVEDVSVIGRSGIVDGDVGSIATVRASGTVPGGTCVVDDTTLGRNTAATETTCAGVCVVTGGP